MVAQAHTPPPELVEGSMRFGIDTTFVPLHIVKIIPCYSSNSITSYQSTCIVLVGVAPHTLPKGPAPLSPAGSAAPARPPAKKARRLIKPIFIPPYLSRNTECNSLPTKLNISEGIHPNRSMCYPHSLRVPRAQRLGRGW
ncbi:MAG: hypothetical protein GFH27_549293n26 [Chloroflexi bacterium AL-W]|nr:hypothetical protein [Chloroflexi bacterium AL-N5]NOK82159.1 hypothetical protein [Chloroflexi bacterium AL-W]NOK90004.1 hypothetical protein [Chloroflexi bacterium AL-N15]